MDSKGVNAPVRKATVIKISIGETWRGKILRPHEVKEGDRVLVEMKHAKLLPGFEKERIYTCWWTYILGMIEDEDLTVTRRPGDVV